MMPNMINTKFDFQAEAGGRDSDKYSPTLQEYHRLLWSKPLPGGEMFSLTKISGNRLYHKSELGEFFLSSDRAVPTFSGWKRLEHVVSQVSNEQLQKFEHLADTIGGIVVWPSNQVEGMPTINAARGFDRKIVDRLDITIECIRRYYLGQDSSLHDTLDRYREFFNLFGGFKGYIDFFLLQDAVSEDYTTVNIATPFDNFNTSPAPSSVDEYVMYMEATAKFVEARNERIAIVAIQIEDGSGT